MLRSAPDCAPLPLRSRSSREAGSTVSTTAFMVVVCSVSTERHEGSSETPSAASIIARRSMVSLLRHGTGWYPECDEDARAKGIENASVVGQGCGARPTLPWHAPFMWWLADP